MNSLESVNDKDRRNASPGRGLHTFIRPSLQDTIFMHLQNTFYAIGSLIFIDHCDLDMLKVQYIFIYCSPS